MGWVILGGFVVLLGISGIFQAVVPAIQTDNSPIVISSSVLALIVMFVGIWIIWSHTKRGKAWAEEYNQDHDSPWWIILGCFLLYLGIIVGAVVGVLFQTNVTAGGLLALVFIPLGSWVIYRHTGDRVAGTKSRNELDPETRTLGKGASAGWYISGGVLMSVGITGLILGATGAAEESPIAVVMIGLTFLSLGIWVLLRNTKQSKEKREERQRQRRETWKRYQRSLSNLLHIAGLPLAEGVSCCASIQDELLTIQGGGITFQLGLDKIAGAQVKTETEIQRAYVSSIGGAVAGAWLFGTLGAIIGGRVKKKETETTDFYLIVTYQKEGGEIKYISFQTYSPGQAQEFADILKQNRDNNSRTVVKL